MMTSGGGWVLLNEGEVDGSFRVLLHCRDYGGITVAKSIEPGGGGGPVWGENRS